MIAGILGMLICVGIPAAAAVYFGRRRDGTLYLFLLGVLSFLVSQLFLRMPLVGWLGSHWDTFMLLPHTNPVLYYAVMGFSAGIFEETGRYVGFRCFGKGRTSWMDGLAFGLGHGSFEAAYIGVIGILPALLSGKADGMAIPILLSAMERLFAMMIQIGLTFVVLYGVKKKKFRFWWLAVLLHGMVDFLLILGNPMILEGLIAAEGIFAMGLVLRKRKKWDQM